MSVTKFTIRLGLYDEAFTNTNEYEQLSIDYPGSLTPQHAYRVLCGHGKYARVGVLFSGPYII